MQFVIAPLVIARDEEGKDLYLYAGAIVPASVKGDQLKRLKADGMISADDADLYQADAAADVDAKPAGNASLEDWQAYATAQGDEPGELSRNDLRDKYSD